MMKGLSEWSVWILEATVEAYWNCVLQEPVEITSTEEHQRYDCIYFDQNLYLKEKEKEA